MRLAAVAFAICISASSAAALTVTDAKVDKGSVQVKGKDAAPSAPITWEGKIATTASKSGAFRFTTPDVPADCVGDVGDGTSVASAVIGECAQGSQQLVVKDATGNVIGPYMLNSDSSEGRDSVILTSPDGPVLTTITVDSIGLNLAFTVYFESSDCSGPALRSVSTEPVTREYTAYKQVVYYPRRTAVATTTHSYEFPSDAAHCNAPHTFTAPDRCCCVDCERAGSQAPPGTIDVSGFVPPFHVELR